jgi:cell division protein FtsQ
LKRINYRKIFTALAWIFVLGGFFSSLGFVSGREENIVAKSLDIRIDNNDDNTFITEKEIAEFFTDRDKPVLSKQYSHISIPDIERMLNAHPAIENAEISADLNGELNVSITQREPVLRVINKNGESYYIDSRSRIMPLNDNYSARVLVANGELFEPFARRYQFTVDQIAKNKLFSEVSLLDDLLKVTRHIQSDTLLSTLIHQIYVNSEKDLELFPSVGNHRIIFGNAENVAEKFNKLKLFYTQGLNKSDKWTKYSTINLKYNNLVVCTRK